MGGGGVKLIFLQYKLKNNLQFITVAYPGGGGVRVRTPLVEISTYSMA
jgi:hypothetical protein